MTNPSTPTSNTLKIVTSIAPRGLEHQQQAVASWRTLGFHVVSLNCAEEIAVLHEVFPDVEFVEVTRDGRALTGRPLVYFDDILAYYRDTGDTICGIVNSDIMLKNDPAFLEIVTREASDALVYGSRVDVENTENRAGGVYRGGFDFFFFPNEFLGFYPASSFMLGMPWWDYWVPTVALLRGMNVKRLDSFYAFHEIHKINYSTERYLDFGQEFAGHLVNLLPAGLEVHFPALDDPDNLDIPKLGACTTRFLENYSVSLTKAAYDAAPYNAAGESAFAQGDYDQALLAFQQALSVSPEDVRTLNNLAVLSWQLGDHEAAAVFVGMAHANAPDDRNTVFNFVDIQVAMNRKDPALAACQHYLTIRREDPEMRDVETELKRSITTEMDEVLEALFSDL
ncbi:MAG: tetratricopeptide repeat protein [Gammaproteobacteria bacterium]|nr:tetratricopeptide repeat protein [Gammaproteobacteria bacterium]